MVFAQGGHGAGAEPVPYQCIYSIGGQYLKSGVTLWLEDTGVWYADASGRPARAPRWKRFTAPSGRTFRNSNGNSNESNTLQRPLPLRIEFVTVTELFGSTRIPSLWFPEMVEFVIVDCAPWSRSALPSLPAMVEFSMARLEGAVE